MGPAPFTKWYESNGGAIQVQWTGTQLRLLDVQPAPGFRSDADVQPDRIRVVFQSDEDDDDDDVVRSRIEVALVDGEIRVQIS